MDIKFHISKIINSGNNADDWLTLIDQLKRNKCDRDILVQIYTVALENISSDTSATGYKKMMVGLANLQR